MSAAIGALVLRWLRFSRGPGSCAGAGERASIDSALSIESDRVRSSIAAECCTGCGVPPLLAPELFEDGAPVCRVRRQPQTVTELRRALRVFRQQDLSCVRYRGGHSRVRFVLEKVGCSAHADAADASVRETGQIELYPKEPFFVPLPSAVT